MTTRPDLVRSRAPRFVPRWSMPLRFAAACAFALSLPAVALAQGFDFEAIGSGVPGVYSLPFRIVDVNGDGAPDLVYMPFSQTSIRLHLNLGDGRFGAATDIASVTAPFTMPPSFEMKDVDGDGDLDLVYLYGDYTGASVPGTIAVAKNDGTGVFTPSFSTASPAAFPLGVLANDFDGDLDTDLIVTHYGGSFFVHLLRNDGTGQFTSTPTPISGGSIGETATMVDLDADGDQDLVSTIGNGISFAYVNDGSGTFAITPASTLLGSLLGATFVDLDNDGDLDAVQAAAAGGGYFLVARLNQGSLVFSAPILIPGATLPNGARFVASDFDGDGLADVIVDGGFTQANVRFFKNLGAGNFTQVSGSSSTAGASMRAAADLDSDGDLDLFALVGTGNFSVVRNTLAAGLPFCFGDGSGVACPCGNTSAPGAKAGCLNSAGSAGTLRAAGGASLSDDSLVLLGTNMPQTSTVIYLQGTAPIGAGSGVVLGDGLRCAGGTLTRLGIVSNTAGASTFPSVGGTTLSVLGGATAGSTRVYQGWYRDPVVFCTSSGFNLTNGLQVLWVP